MSNAYVRDSDGRTTPMERVRCKNEDEELQSILEMNPDLLPGEQINPEDPRRWLQIARELPVPDPATGTDRWSIDNFFADQSAMPTFIECKRFRDTRARREVIGQMFEYAANGHHYWSKELLRSRAEELSKQHQTSLESVFKSLHADDDLDIESYFERLEDNLREGQLRLVFFMEEAPMELKSLVDFLNKQMERSEVLLVEARQYRHEGITVVVPTLFGYTEEARQVKRTVTVTAGSRKYWNYESFFEDANNVLGETSANNLKDLYATCKELSCDIRWGTGKLYGSCLIGHPLQHNRAFMVLFSDGSLSIYFAQLQETDELLAFRDAFKDGLISRMGINITEEDLHKYPSYKKDQWIKKVDVLINLLKELMPEYLVADM